MRESNEKNAFDYEFSFTVANYDLLEQNMSDIVRFGVNSPLGGYSKSNP